MPESPPRSLDDRPRPMTLAERHRANAIMRELRYRFVVHETLLLQHVRAIDEDTFDLFLDEFARIRAQVHDLQLILDAAWGLGITAEQERGSGRDGAA